MKVGYALKTQKGSDIHNEVKSEMIILFIVFAITIFVVLSTLNRINLHIAIETMKGEGINYDHFREMILPIEEKVLKEYVNTTKKQYDLYDYLALNTFLLQNDYPGIQRVSTHNEKELLKGLVKNSSFEELKGYLHAILEDSKVFPMDVSLLEDKKINYTDSWNYLRSYGGKRKHEGTDIMSAANVPDVIKVLSMSNGTVEKMGWLEKGGYRVGIRGENGGYFYYAHLSSYDQELNVGDEVMAGDLLGYMGDSGYGIEGTTGMFPVHLHVGIYIDTPFGELSVNPYLILKLLENKKVNK